MGFVVKIVEVHKLCGACAFGFLHPTNITIKCDDNPFLQYNL